MTSGTVTGLTLDTGALLALDHPGKAIAMQARLDEALWRGHRLRSRRHHRTGVAQFPSGPAGRLLKSRDIDIAVLTPNVARSVGLLCARSGHDDVIDVHVALCARERGHAVATSDPDDMLRIDHALPVIKV